MPEPKRGKINAVTKDQDGNIISGTCSGCGRTFKFEDVPNAIGRRVEAAFTTHDCKREEA